MVCVFNRWDVHSIAYRHVCSLLCSAYMTGRGLDVTGGMQRKVSDPSGKAVSFHMDAGSGTWVLWKSRKSS